MNWKEIKKKYPKAHKKFGIWADKHGEYCDIDLEYLWINYPPLCETLNHTFYDDRDLYDFFDEQGIIIEIICEYKPNLGWRFMSYINYRLSCENNWISKWYKSRKKVEEAAFLKAFEILEK